LQSAVTGDAALVLQLLGGHVGHIQVAGRAGGDVQRQVVSELAELLGAGHKVRLAVHFHHHAHAAAAVRVQLHQAVARLAAGLLGGRG